VIRFRFSHSADLPAHLGQFADQFVPGFGLILHHGSDSFICQKMALGLQKGSATQVSQ
jgi:hypothetical protein